MVTIYTLRIIGTKWIYVGATTNPHKRRKQHFYDLKGNRHTNQILQSLFNSSTYDEPFRFDVQEECSIDEAQLRECIVMNKMAKRYDVCNLRPAGRVQIGKTISEATRQKLSAARRGKPCRRKPLTTERSLAMTKKRGPHTDEQRAQIRRLGYASAKRVMNVSTGQIFPSATDAALAYKCSQRSITDAVRGKLARVKGCVWRYHTETVP